MFHHFGRRPHRLTTLTATPLQWARPKISATPATAAPNAAAAGSAIALVPTDGTDGTFVGSRWYAWNETFQTLGALIGEAGSIASDTEAVTRKNFFYGNSGQTLDLVVILPQDPGGLNPQRSAGLNPDGGIILQNWRNVSIVGGAFDFRNDFVREAGGIGLHLLDTSTTSTAVAGGGYHDERMRAMRVRDYAGTVHIEGVHFGGAFLYEAIDVSHGTSAASVLQIQRCQFGSAAQHVKNLNSFNNFYTSNDGTVRQTLKPTFDHSGGDCLQCWTGPRGSIRVADCTFYTNFQALFLAWDDQSGSTTPPSSFDLRRNEIHSYVSGPYLYYDTKSGTLNPPAAYFEDNFLIAEGYTKTLSTMFKSGGYAKRSGVVSSGIYAGREYADWVGTTFPAGSEHTGAEAFRSGVPLDRVGPQGTYTGGRVGALYSPSLWTAAGGSSTPPPASAPSSFSSTYGSGF